MTKREQTQIHNLSDDQGTFKETLGEILEITHKYYTKLYDADRIAVTEQNFFLKNFSQRLTELQRRELDPPLEISEIQEALLTMKKGKTPGPDGLSVEFYVSCWPIIQNEFATFLKFLQTNQKVDDRIKTGLLTLLFKIGERDQLENYRPISLLNYDLKIFTKCLANRLKKVMNIIVQEHQYAKPGSTILTATILLRGIYCINMQSPGVQYSQLQFYYESSIGLPHK